MNYVIIKWKPKWYTFFNYLVISNVYTGDISQQIKSTKANVCYFGAFNQVMWKVIYIVTVITNYTAL